MSLETAGVPNRSLYQSLAYSDPISHFVGGVDFMTPINDLQNVRDKADLASNFVKPLNSMPHDIDRARASDKWYKDKLEEITNYESPHEQLRAARKLGQLYAEDSTNGERAHITKSLNNYNETVKEATDKLDKGVAHGGIDEVGYWKMVHQPLEKFKGTIENGKGGYDVFQGGKVGSYSDMAKEASDFAQQWSPDQGFTATSDGGYINEKTHKYVSKQEVEDQVYSHLANNPKYREQLSHFVEYHGKEGVKQLDRLLVGIARPIANRESFDQYDGNMKEDQYGLYDFKKAREKQELASPVGNSNTEVINNPNHKDLLKDINLNDKGQFETQAYKKIVNGKQVPISKKEYEEEAIKYGYLPNVGTWTPSGSGQMTGMSQGRDMFDKKFKKVNAEKVDIKNLYDTNKDFRQLVLNQAKIDFRKYQDHFSKEDSADYPNPYIGEGKLGINYINQVAKNYKETVKNNAEIPLVQDNNDSEQILNNGYLTLANLQSGTFIPLDEQARSLAKQKGGDLDYQQLTQDGWTPTKVENSGTIYGTGHKDNNIGQRSVITLQKGTGSDKETKKVSVLSRLNQEGLQNTHEAHTVNAIASIIQSKHDGKVFLGPNLVADIKTDYTSGGGQTVDYTDKNGNPISIEELEKNNIPFRTPQDLLDHYKEILMEVSQELGVGHRGKKTAATTDLNIEQ